MPLWLRICCSNAGSFRKGLLATCALGLGSKSVTCACPQKINILSRIVVLNPCTIATAMIITATLNIVAAVARRMMNDEKVDFLFRAILAAMKYAVFNAGCV
ncbi:hypothetical protein D3C72_776130 [compost metagenome]